MKYRVLTMMGILALTAGTLMRAQDYDDIYYDASKSTGAVKTSAKKPTKTVTVYGEVPEKYKVAAQDNYRLERDVDEYNRRGNFEPEYEVDLNGDTIYEDAFANTRRIERFYNPDVVILSDDDDLVELYYDESPTINLVVGSDWGYASYGWASSYYPWYTGWYSPWYIGWGSPWRYSWYSPWHYGWYSPYYHGYYPWYASSFYWDSWWWGRHGGWHGHHYADWTRPHRSGYDRHIGGLGHRGGIRSGLATNRNGRSRSHVDMNRPSSMPSRNGNRPSGINGSTSRSRGGYASSRGGSGNMGSRNSSGVVSRGSVSRSVNRSSSAGSRSYSGNSSSGSRSYSGGSRSSGGSHSSGSYSGGSRSSGGGGGGGSRGSSGGGGRRR